MKCCSKKKKTFDKKRQNFVLEALVLTMNNEPTISPSQLTTIKKENSVVLSKCGKTLEKIDTAVQKQQNVDERDDDCEPSSTKIQEKRNAYDGMIHVEVQKESSTNPGIVFCRKTSDSPLRIDCISEDSLFSS